VQELWKAIKGQREIGSAGRKNGQVIETTTLSKSFPTEEEGWVSVLNTCKSSVRMVEAQPTGASLQDLESEQRMERQPPSEILL
jgi:hypothetical protein